MNHLNKGTQTEDELQRLLEEKGFFVIRVPQSGRSQPFPDLIVPSRGILYGFEVKFVNKERVKLYEDKYDNLIEWLIGMRKGGIPSRGFLAVKLIDKWFFNEIDFDVKEIELPNEDSLDFDGLVRVLKGKKRRSRKLNISIRLMGDKQDVYRVLRIIKEALEKEGFSLGLREYVMYKNKKERKEIDTTRTRIYIVVKEKRQQT